VILESPYAGNVELHLAYARRCLLDSLRRGEAPIAFHLLYTQVLDDTVPDERHLGMMAGWAWRRSAHAGVFYIDHGMSPGMRSALTMYEDEGITVESRSIGR